MQRDYHRKTKRYRYEVVIDKVVEVKLKLQQLPDFSSLVQISVKWNRRNVEGGFEFLFHFLSVNELLTNTHQHSSLFSVLNTFSQLRGLFRWLLLSRRLKTETSTVFDGKLLTGNYLCKENQNLTHTVIQQVLAVNFQK